MLPLLVVLPSLVGAFQLHGQRTSRPLAHNAKPLGQKSSCIAGQTAVLPIGVENPKPNSFISSRHATPLHGSIVRLSSLKQHRLRKGFASMFQALLKRGVTTLSPLRKAMRTFAVIISLCVMFSPLAASAVSGGRVGGGGFHSSPAPRSRPAPSRSRPSSYGGPSYHRPSYNRPSSHGQPSYGRPTYVQPRMQYHRPTTIVPIFVPPRMPVDSSQRIVVSNDARIRDIAIVSSAAAVLAYGLTKGQQDKDDDTKVHVGSLTVTFSVPNRRNSLLEKIRNIAVSADTVHGIDGLVSDVCIELMRNLPSIDCAYAESSTHTTMDAAQQAYHRQSVLTQSKFDSFGINKYGTTDKSLPRLSNAEPEDSSRPTLALVTIHYASDEKQPTNLYTRDDLRQALSQLATCNPRAAEVIWAPGEVNELLDAETVYADFPQLIPI